MSHTFETRCVSATLVDPIGVARVACIGDSMMFGFCAPSRDCLPSQLNRILNQAYPENFVFVDNFGQTSGNIWDAWPHFKLLSQTTRFDAVVFSVCQNDLDLFATHGSSYGRYHLENFKEGAPQWDSAVDLFCDVAAWRQATGRDVLVIFYSFHATDRPMIDRLAPLLASLELPFIDMLAFFRGETAITVETYRVSEFDGHPSPMAHELAARRVAREFRAKGFLAKSPCLGEDACAALALAVRSMTDQGLALDAALLWAIEAVRAKRSSAHRRTATGRAAADALAIWNNLEELALSALKEWRHRARRRARSALFERDWRAHEPYFANLTAYRRRLESAIFVLINSRSAAELAAKVALLPQGAFQQAGKQVTFDGDVAALAREWRQKVSRAATGMALSRPSDAVDFANPLTSPEIANARARDIGIEAVLADEFQFIEAQIKLLEGYARRCPESIGPDAPEHRLLRALRVDFNSAFVYVNRLVAMLESRIPMTSPEGPPWTIVEVTVEGASKAKVKDHTFDLVVEMTYAEPRRGVVRDRQLAGAVKERGVYRFEFPLMMRGDVTVRVPPRGVNQELFATGRARFAAVKIGNADWNFDFPEDGKTLYWGGSETALTEVDLRDVVLS